MQPNRDTPLRRYQYDALNRLVAVLQSAQAPTQQFYLAERLITEIQQGVQRSIMQYQDQVLALQQRQSGAVQTGLIATDQQRSVIDILEPTLRKSLSYTPYGFHPPRNGLASVLGFNGERLDSVIGCYVLGNGYRMFNPILMRFNSPDSLSPFGGGGLNPYSYCLGDPINFVDPTGHIPGLKSLLGIKKASQLFAAKPAAPQGGMRNVTKLADDAFTFETTHKGGSRLTISAHGSGNQPGNIIVGGKLWNADDVIKNIDLKPYDQVRILACFSDQIGAEIALKSGKEVKAYIGKIKTNLTDNQMRKIYQFYDSTKIPDLGIISLNIRKSNSYDPVTQPLEHSSFNYQPVRFRP